MTTARESMVPRAVSHTKLDQIYLKTGQNWATMEKYCNSKYICITWLIFLALMNWPTEIKRNIYSIQHQIGPKTGQNLVKMGKIWISMCETAFSVRTVFEFIKHRLCPVELYWIHHRLLAIQRRQDTRLPSRMRVGRDHFWGHLIIREGAVRQKTTKPR